MSDCYSTLPTPCYLFSEAAIEKNLTRARQLQQNTGCRLLLALKSFAVWRLFNYFSPALCGVTASSLNEALLGAEFFGGEVHAFAPAWRPDEFARVADLTSHIIFNSHAQWEQYGKAAKSCGMRINPNYSEVKNPLYNPCRPRSQFGVAANAAFLHENNNIEGLHFHALCEQNADSLERVAAHVHTQFENVLARMRWVNLGGGHLLCGDDYDNERLAAIIADFQKRYGVTVYLEPGAGLVMDTCRLVTTVLDVRPDNVAVLDASASAHAPDVLEAPYRPNIVDAGQDGEKPHTYRLCGPTCMAGDIFGDYSFSAPLRIGTQLYLEDMAAYTTVKSTVFNGIPPPAIALELKNGTIDILRVPKYDDYRQRVA